MLNKILLNDLRVACFNHKILKKDIHNNMLACKKIIESAYTSKEDKLAAWNVLSHLEVAKCF